ncbi:DUF3426 domain-containing protein [Phenylobacterium sp.]|uniref:DUF3426 domain-containing protein n=1 Tax=Phenylobacterium sp. TaxID=1871053 RepID=UPI00121C6376|nr:DUF3426 domain-containing protein [Phenylobacterium sp.]THD52165.1 MAG: DUF3426 domain-containing protein [Phenylobacterium sp.]
MILTCPECATSYFVDDSRIAAAGRTVKCSSCGARWTALPEGAEPPAPKPPKSAPVAASAPSASLVDEVVFEAPIATPVVPRKAPPPRREGNGKALIWAGAAVVVAAVVAGAIVFRAQVVRLLPASQAAYAGIGLPVSALAIEQVHADAGFQGGHPALSITGQLRNQRDEAATAPPLRLSLLDRLGRPVAVKVARPIDAIVPARAVRHFAISIVDPPASTHDLEVSFQPEGKAAHVTVAAPTAAAALPAVPPASK